MTTEVLKNRTKQLYKYSQITPHQPILCKLLDRFAVEFVLKQFMITINLNYVLIM